MEQCWDVVVIGTGFGGSMASLPLVQSGLRVLLIERGRWVDRDASAWDPQAILIDRKYRSASPYEHGPRLLYPDEAVGGMEQFKRRIANHAGPAWNAEHIVLTSTHTHSGPESLALSDLYRTEPFRNCPTRTSPNRPWSWSTPWPRILWGFTTNGIGRKDCESVSSSKPKFPSWTAS